MRFWRGSQSINFFKDESGTVLLIVAFGMVAIMGFMALAVDVGQLRYQRRNLQRVADGAALAGALELASCYGTLNCTNMQNAAKSAAIENGLTPDTLVTNCGAAPTTGIVLTVNNPPCAQGSADPNNGKSTYVEILVTQPQSTLFAGLLGTSSVPLAARAEAAPASATCIYALNPSGSGALTVDGLAGLTTSCGIIVQSTSSSALNCGLLAVVNAPSISVAGGVSPFLCYINPAPKTEVSSLNTTDPLANLPAPTVPACGTTTTSPFHGAPSAVTVTTLSSAVFYADQAYCGGISILSGATATFQPGTYVLTSSNGASPRNPGGLSVDLGTSVTGTGVTFYNYGPNGGITMVQPVLSLGGVQLKAPTSGTYSGILFFQPSNNTSQATLIGSSVYNTTLEGTYYFPKAKVVYALSGLTNYNILIAYNVEFTLLTLGSSNVTSTFNSNYTSLASGSPVPGYGAVLTQ
jgi:Flp pilus assembly protein TadG